MVPFDARDPNTSSLPRLMSERSRPPGAGRGRCHQHGIYFGRDARHCAQIRRLRRCRCCHTHRGRSGTVGECHRIGSPSHLERNWGQIVTGTWTVASQATAIRDESRQPPRLGCTNSIRHSSCFAFATGCFGSATTRSIPIKVLPTAGVIWISTEALMFSKLLTPFRPPSLLRLGLAPSR